MHPNLTIAGVDVPRFLYGTAWKEESTQRLTEQALRIGFRGIDTANQRRHYDEASVGRGIAASIAVGVVSRDEMFIQTKFTFRRGQDHRLPYDPAAPIATQVEQSLASSLQHLQVEQIDSYVLHGPATSEGITADDRSAWCAMEDAVQRGQTRLLGVSNVSFRQLELLCDKAKVPPRFVQNRCFAITGWDRQVRNFCQANGIAYQAFSLLTANKPFLASPQLTEVAERYRLSVSQLVFRFAIQAGMIPLTGTTNANHMQADLQIFETELQLDDFEMIDKIGRA